MSFSIVTVALNAGPDLALTLESVLQQDFADVESILVDGGSWDNTAEVIRRYAGDLSRVVHMEDAGIYQAMNASLEHCSKDYTLFLNANDRFFSANVLSKFWASREGDPDFMFGDHVYVDGRSERLTRAAVFETIRERLRRGDLRNGWQSSIPCHQSTFTRTSLLREMGYDHRLEICADHDLMFRAYDAGHRFQYVDEIVSFYVGGGYSARRAERCRQETSYVYRRYSAAPELVDRAFYPEGSSPFSPETAWTGVALGGLTAPGEGGRNEAGGEVARWCAAQVFELLSPTRGLTACLRLRGRNHLADQRLTAMHGARVLGSADIPEGMFTEHITFCEPVAPGSVVRVFADRYGSGRAHGVSHLSLELLEASLPLLQASPGLEAKLGQPRLFGLKSGDCWAEAMLLSGWSGMEDAHTWSVGPSSNLLVCSADRPERLALVLAGNPHAPALSRYVEVAVNGVSCGRHTLCLGPSRVEAQLCGVVWEPHGVNVVSLRPGLPAKPGGGDLRPLGVCLYALTLEG